MGLCRETGANLPCVRRGGRALASIRAVSTAQRAGQQRPEPELGRGAGEGLEGPPRRWARARSRAHSTVKKGSLNILFFHTFRPESSFGNKIRELFSWVRSGVCSPGLHWGRGRGFVRPTSAPQLCTRMLQAQNSLGGTSARGGHNVHSCSRWGWGDRPSLLLPA